MRLFKKEKKDIRGTSAVLKEFDRLRDGEQLPREGACSFFYKTFTYAGETIPMTGDKGYRFFHVDHDDVIQEILSGTASINCDADGNKIILSIIFKTGEILNRLQLVIDRENRDSGRIFDFLLKHKKIEINFLNLVYGGMVKQKTLAIPLHKEILGRLKTEREA
jgi:hypothetical protein